MSFYIYFLYSESANKFYVGHSQDPWKRVIEHNTVQHLTYTSKFRPWLLKAVFFVGENVGEAVKIEKFIKKQKSRLLLEKLIDPNYEPGEKLAQLVRVPHVRD